MLLRVVRGSVAPGREADFVAICRREVVAGARAPGLVGLFPGYRRVGGTDRFVLASTWESEDDARRTAGTARSTRASTTLADVATIDSVDEFEVGGPAFAGIVDAPGGIVRVTSAFIRPGRRGDLYAWLAAQGRATQSQRLLLGWAIGERDVDDRRQVVSVSVWPSPLVIEALADPGRTGTTLFASLDEFVTEAVVEQYQAIALDLPSEVADVTARRMVAARFAARHAADEASRRLTAAIASSAEMPHSVAPLGVPGASSDVPSWIMVARVSAGDYAAAERLISDSDGEIILTSREPGDDQWLGQPGAPVERGASSGRHWSASPAD
jgi:heme-degrading monooxygenase HmoA